MNNENHYEPRMLTIETIFTGSGNNDVLTDLYMDPQDVRRTPPPKLPDRNKPIVEKPPTVPPKRTQTAVHVSQGMNGSKN